MLLMAAMGPPGGGRNQISERLLSRFNVINLTFPSESQITRIYGTLLSQHVAEFDEDVRMIGNLPMNTILIYSMAQQPLKSLDSPLTMVSLIQFY